MDRFILLVVGAMFVVVIIMVTIIGVLLNATVRSRKRLEIISIGMKTLTANNALSYPSPGISGQPSYLEHDQTPNKKH